ncbi:LysR family transcriptional regulator [Streptomyces sp. ME19-01-6]|uniref:LysR family transcriptional regulator n=1 Tax=Streptomyces sp. ME19-01-6 TaxID=3028686 RepID=UPI0029B8A1B6|nr:LysR family transcriptional regulator [Streptomyces sp. ME19-01-6]MDX3232158.1 LysR family transcriptional regulator [Streptomyces sp. ME19-01-6]
MDLIRHLRLFIVVAEELHFSRAADLLGMAQPPLSQAVRRLEGEMGVELFDRSRRQVRLTAAGALLLREARELLAREERLRTVMHRARAGEPATLRAGVPPQTPARTLHALLAACADQCPGLRIDLQEVDTAEQVRLLSRGRLDVGWVHHPVACEGATDLTLGPMVGVELGVVLARTSPLARLPEVSLADLSGHDLVLFPWEGAPGWYDRTLDLCRAGGFAPTAVRHARNPEFLVGLVAAGCGVAFDDGRVAGREPRVIWRPLAGRPLVQQMSAVWPKERTHPEARRFAGVAAEAVARDATTARRLPARPDEERHEERHQQRPRPWSVVFEPGAGPAPDHTDG